MSEQTTEEKHVNPLLEKVAIPGETFRLPSGGLFYTRGEISEDVTDGEVLVNPMNAMDELLMKSPDKLLSGTAVTDIFRRCIPDVIKPEELLAKDVDYLLMCLRLVSYGPNYDLYTTHMCEEAKEHSYAIPLRPLLQQTKSVDPTSLKNYKLKLKNGQVVGIHPPKFLATVKLYELFGAETGTYEDFENVGEKLIDSVGDMINDVDGHEDKNDVREWLKTIRVGDVQTISDKVAELSDWGIDPSTTVECKDCGEKMEVFVPVNPISFFT